MTNKYDCGDQLAASVGLLEGTQTFQPLNRTLHQLSRHASKLVTPILSAMVSTIILPMLRDSSAGFSYSRQPRRTSGQRMASIIIPFRETVQVIMISLIT